MPRFFFDIFDGESLWVDDEGTEHATLDAARREAVETLTQISRESFAPGKAVLISIDIRPEQGVAVERVTIALAFPKP